jgi:MATE family multidrug resistance protein
MIVNVGANYVLIFGKLGFPALGIRGAAYGTIIGGVCGLGILIAAYFFVRIRMEYHIARSFRLDWDVMRRLVKFGYPAGLEFFLNLTAFTVMISIFHSEGPVVATAATITFNWDMVAFVPLVGIEIAVTSLVGRYMGARQPDTAHKAAMSGIKTGSIYSAVMLILFVAFPLSLVNVFRPEVHDVVFTRALPITLFMVQTMAFYVWFEAVVVALCGALRGAGDTFWAMCISVTLHWLMVGLLVVIFKVLNASAQVAWVALMLWFLLFSFIFYLRYRGGKWRSMRVIEEPNPAA